MPRGGICNGFVTSIDDDRCTNEFAIGKNAGENKRTVFNMKGSSCVGRRQCYEPRSHSHSRK